MKKVLFLIIALFCYGTIFAEEKTSNKSYVLQEIIVTESKYPQSQQEITHKIDTIEQKEISEANYPNRNITEAIKYQPGNFVNPLSRNDANWGSYGGLGPKYNTWFLDGLPIDSFVDPMSLDAIYIDRIEVHRGPASVLYPNYMTMDFAGNETPLAGITNLITKEKIDKEMTNISLGYGTWNTIRTRFYHEGNAGAFNFFLGSTYEQSDYTNYGTNPSWLNMIDNPNYQKIKAYFKTTYFFDNDTKLSLFAHHTKHDGDAGRPHRGYDHQYDVINLNFSKAFTSNLELQARGGFRYYHRSWEEDNYPTNLSLREKDGVKQNIYPLDVVLNIKHFGKSLLNIGFDLQNSDYETYSRVSGIKSVGNDVMAKNYGAYVQEKLILEKWVFRLGARYNYTTHDYDLIGGTKPYIKEKSWDKLLGSVGVRYNISERAGIYANAGTSFLVPSAKSVGGTLSPGDYGVPGKNGQLPNPNLKPETGYSYDLGADFWINKINIGIRGFYHIVEDTIVTNVVFTTPSQSQDVNAGKSKTKGLEFELNHYVNNNFRWFANTTYTNTEVENSIDKKQDGSDIPFVPEFIANAGLNFSLPNNFSISPYFQYIGKYYDSTDKTNRREFGDYATVNLNIKKHLVTTDKYYAVLTLELNNLFDKKYEMPWQFQDPGFNAMLSFDLYF